MNSTLKIQRLEPTTLIEKIKAEIKKRSEAKAKRMLLKRPRRLPALLRIPLLPSVYRRAEQSFPLLAV